MGQDLIAFPAREQMVERLCKDLIGPALGDEVLNARPSDIYLTGILWPKNTKIAPEEDERLAVAPGEGEEGDDADDQSQPASVPMRRPSTAGLSFAARSAGDGSPEVRVSITLGRYLPTEVNGATCWRRIEVVPAPRLLALVVGGQDYDLRIPDLPGLRLNLRCSPYQHGTLATVTLVNGCQPEGPGRDEIERVTLFQVSLSVEAADSTVLIARPSRRAVVDDEDRSAALLYKDAREYAAGHTCSADWSVNNNGDTARVENVRTTWMPQALVPAISADGHALFRNLRSEAGDVFSAAWLSMATRGDLTAALTRFCNAYEQWINDLARSADGLSGSEALTADQHLDDTRIVLQRMRGGVSRLGNDEHAASAFRLANLAMETQRTWGRNGSLWWRPFQLGFLLLTLESAIDGRHEDREVMDLLWFPTGGGKTEAYLALIAMVAFHRRLSYASPDDGAGVACIMRYTLRLLTTQQFIRAAAMICACEAIRRKSIPSLDADGLGATPFSIGLWVGEGATPNTRKGAFESKSDSSRATPQQLVQCPCCHSSLHYQQQHPADAVSIFCTDQSCLLAGPASLPVWTVDEDVYAARPTMLIGTVDKFAQIVRKPQTADLFGVGVSAQPQLILQDELHLIAGPLGTLCGLYETALDLILSANGTRPKIIGSTATIRRAADQVQALFDRRTCQFPPPGLDASDSGFAVVNPDAPGRRYLGVTTAGRSAKFTLQAVAASLLQAAAAGLAEADRDPYWTLVAYFNSLRELGGALVLMQDDVNDTLRLLAQARREAPREPAAVEELTSRRSQKDVRHMLDLLATPAGADGALDVVLATNMLSVGVDIPRLGLMLVNGQPKTMAEYIQVTSRVGRGEVPGLVIPILNNAKPRDRSHYETFKTWHATLYRDVEATSVTPFASRARDRALHAVLVAVIRHLVPGMLSAPVLNDEAIAAAEALIERISERAARVDKFETDVRAELQARLNRWIRRAPQHYWSFASSESLLQGAEQAAARRAAGRSIGQAWPTPNSMRGVEPATPYRLAEGLRRTADNG
ncbi:helicase-related protein [Paenalcaligenes niemegkensis]|uniref:helicase-related protein n=1 Tax=Paenalcaligenes niemegkensis TaxID=2895469 RepID=UPI001EE9039B|nr:helicase-related protein [Paenalcaligenes niemegkensis]MCQ9617977.1 helicase-related protein [Paenalcaligenes niemegkensis]